MKRSFVLARVGNRNFSSLSQHCGRCTYYLRRSWKRAKMPLNGHLRKPKTLCLLPSHYPFHEVKKGVADASRTSSPAPCFVWKHIFPQFFPPPIFRVLQRNRERFPSMIFFFFFFLHYCSLAWSTIATMLRLIVRVIVSSPSASTVIKYFVSTSVHASSSRFRKMRLWQFCLGGSLFVIYGSCFR